MSHTVEFEGDGPVAVDAGQSLLDAALRSGIRHVHVCGGTAKCSTCRVLVLEGGASLSAPNEAERLLNTQLHFPRNVRLACQTTVTGTSIKLKRIIQDESDIGLYIGGGPERSSQQIGEELELVLFFCDIRDFTAFAETHLPFDVIHIIRKLFSGFQKTIQEHNGEIIETMGDGFYAVFSCEQGSSESVCAAIQSGLAIIADLDNLNETYFKPYFDQHLKVGIGVHIGKVISGVISFGLSHRRVAMGLPVNIAARLQNATKELNNSFIISSEAFNHLPRKPEGFSATAIHLKGITEPLNVFLLGKAYFSAD